jgi:uncharacterized caspase-like protein
MATALACAGSAVAQNEAGSAERRIALLIGIDRYAPGDYQPAALSGPANDVVLARDVLTRRFGFCIEDADVLLGERATHEAIVRTFHSRLIQRADADTRVVVWYSGHGSVVPDLSMVESDKDQIDDAGEPVPSDNSLVAFDSRAGSRHGSYDVSDDEIHSLLRALAAKTEKVVVVMDCCHSGGNVRGGAVRTTGRGKEALDRTAIEPF